MAKRKRKSQAKVPHAPRYRRGDRSDHTQRNAAICARRREGATFDKIASEFDLSREAIRHVVHATEREAERKAKQLERLAPLRAAFAKGVGPRKA